MVSRAVITTIGRKRRNEQESMEADTLAENRTETANATRQADAAKMCADRQGPARRSTEDWSLVAGDMV